MDDSSRDAGPPARTGGAASRLPWRYAELGRWRLASIAARNARGRKSGGKDVDIDDHIRLAVREESAATLGRAGRKLQAAVVALADYDRASAAGAPRPAARWPLLHEAALALWECVVQREAIGITDHGLLEQMYGVTPELWRLMGTADVAGAG
jgi:hypothetical protein